MRIRCPGLLTVTACLLAIVPTTPSTAAPPDTVELHALGKAPVTSVLTGMKDGIQVEGASVAWDSLLSLTFPQHRYRPAKQTSWHAWLIGGERLRGVLRGPALDGDGLTLTVQGVGDLVIPLEQLSALEFVPNDPGPCYGLLAGNPAIKDQDVAYDVGGDALPGTVVRLTAAHVEIEDTRERAHKIVWDRLRLLRLSNDAPKPVTGGWAEIEMLDGTRFSAMGAPTMDGSSLSFQTRSLKAPIRAELAQVRVIRWNGEAFVRASSLPFTAKIDAGTDDHEDIGVNPTMEGVFYKVRVDQRAKMTKPGIMCPMRIAGRSYRYGFAVHSHTELTLTLGKQYTSFQVGLGIDDDVMDVPVDTKGNASARILGDGKVLWEAKSVKGGEDTIAIGPIDVSGVESLVLEVGVGPDEMRTLDRANWVDPILVRK